MLRIILNESFCSIVMFIDNILLVNVYTVCFSPESKSYGCNTIGNQRMDQEDMHTLDTEEERRSCLCQLYTGFWVITCSGINQRVEVMTQGIPVHILIDAFFFPNSCASYVGRIGNRQFIWLAQGCWTTGIVAHEIGEKRPNLQITRSGQKKASNLIYGPSLGLKIVKVAETIVW